MRGAPETMTLIRPRSAAEAVRAFARRPEAVPLAGGTDFMVGWNAGLWNHAVVLDLSQVREWATIKPLRNGVRVGALVTHARLLRHPLVRRRLPLLAQACAVIGGVAIQNRGTLAGNIANASPAGDTFPPLAVYEAMVHTVSSRGRRSVPFLQLFAGVKRTWLEPSELIESVEVPFPRRRPARQMFRKVGTRAAQALSKTVVAGLLWLRPDGRVEELRFALGSMAPTVRRVRAVEAFVAGRRTTPAVVEQACRLLDEEVSPIDDVRSTAEYRMYVSRNLLRSFLVERP